MTRGGPNRVARRPAARRRALKSPARRRRRRCDRRRGRSRSPAEHASPAKNRRWSTAAASTCSGIGVARVLRGIRAARHGVARPARGGDRMRGACGCRRLMSAASWSMAKLAKPAALPAPARARTRRRNSPRPAAAPAAADGSCRCARRRSRHRGGNPLGMSSRAVETQIELVGDAERQRFRRCDLVRQLRARSAARPLPAHWSAR